MVPGAVAHAVPVSINQTRGKRLAAPVVLELTPQATVTLAARPALQVSFQATMPPRVTFALVVLIVLQAPLPV